VRGADLITKYCQTFDDMISYGISFPGSHDHEPFVQSRTTSKSRSDERSVAFPRIDPRPGPT
jgi:hypothetical protein